MVDDYIRHLADGIQWWVIDFKNQTFADEPRNLRFTLSTDGMNPFGVHINVYLRPLIDDFKELWKVEGIRVYDGFKKEHFNLRVMLFTTITDILGHRSMSGQSKGEKDCFHCLDDIETIWLNHSKKRVYKDIAIRHNIDLMHAKKNVYGSLLGTLMNDKWKTKDHAKTRADLEELDIRPELRPDGTSAQPPLSTINLTQEEKQELWDFFHSVKLPSRYATNIRKLMPTRENKMLPMKAHDCDVMLTTMLVVGIRNILPEKTQMAIMSIFSFFNAISHKVIDEQSLEDLEKNMIEVMCLLEAYFSPTFFDISVHLIVHLVKEIRYLGPMFLHHMYPYERFMSTLNSYAKSWVHPEGSMAQCYSTEEVVDWCLGYIYPTNPIGISMSCHEGRLAGRGCVGEKHITPERDAYE
ncbi:uncharacterized protein [Miscanthus floridulus]|uniref:uncharacterized protein n=1 Tax=Miscanthus floridulus TaxID=154761 RepID=UPI0034598A47